LNRLREARGGVDIFPPGTALSTEEKVVAHSCVVAPVGEELGLGSDQAGAADDEAAVAE